MQFYCENMNFVRSDVKKVFSKAGWEVEKDGEFTIVFIKNSQNRVVFDLDRRDTLDVIEILKVEKDLLKKLFYDEGYIVGFIG